MDFLSKVQEVKKNLAQWQKSWGDDFDYLIQEFAYENDDAGEYNVFIHKNEHEDILKYLASVGYLEITKNGSDSPHIIILPKTESTIRLKALELIAKDIGELDNGNNLVDFLIDCGVDKKLIVYPNTKWRMIYAILVELACSSNDKDERTLFKIIGNAVHPLMHKGNTVSTEVLQDKFNTYLSYDNLRIVYNKRAGVYDVIEQLSEDEKKELKTELVKNEKKRVEFLSKPENKEKISLLRKSYQAFMGVVELFCRNFLRLSNNELVELNKHYLALDKTIWSIMDEFKLGDENYRKYPRPFKNLFSAERELDGDIDWNVIRREMSARFGEIETLYQRINASDILAEPDKQKHLNEITLYLSKLKEKTKETEKNDDTKKPSTTRIEITKIPKLQIEGLKDITKTKQRNNKGETNSTDTASRKGYEKKWDILQAIWDVYESHSRPDSILVPIARLTIKGRDVRLIDGIIEGLRKKDLFQKWNRKDRWYDLELINHGILSKVYQEVQNTYRKIAVAYQVQNKKNEASILQTQEKTIPLSKRELRKKINNIIKAGKFGTREKAFLRFLSENFEPKTIEEISKEIPTKACKTLKARVQKKLKNTGFFIETIKPDKWGRKAQYQLKFLTSSASS